MSSDCNAVTHVRRSDFAVRALPPHRKRPEASEHARLSTPHSTVAGLSTISVSPTVRNQAAAKLIDMHGIPDDVRDLLRRHDGILLSADAQRAGVPGADSAAWSPAGSSSAWSMARTRVPMRSPNSTTGSASRHGRERSGC